MISCGIIGFSEGNGHPYSWSAICNGYDPAEMSQCPFPVIPEYLGRRDFPEDQLAGMRVTHIYGQDRALAEHVARAALIPNVVDTPSDLLDGTVDAVLLARDDAERHLEFAAGFLHVGLPVYIDKPLALSVKEAQRIYAAARDPTAQVFSCSAMRFAAEFRFSPTDRRRLGKIRRVEGRIGKSWTRYAVHVIDPVVALIDPDDAPQHVNRTASGKACTVDVQWRSGMETSFVTTGSDDDPATLRIEGESDTIERTFTDTFPAFKSALARFRDVVAGDATTIPQAEVLRVVALVEAGLSAA